MNPTADHRPPPHPHRPSFSCDLHPTEKFNGFCPSCLCDRLTTLNPSSSDATSSLYRRTKSFSSSNRNNVSFEPQRRSCDVRVRVPNEGNRAQKLDSSVGVGNEIRVSEETIEEQSRVRRVPIEAGRAQIPGQNVGEQVRVFEDLISRVRDPIESGGVRNVNRSVGSEIRPFEEHISVEARSSVVHNANGEIEDDFEEEIAVVMEMKKMRDYIDLDFQAKKKKSSAGFWSAASVFSKKWNKWMKKQKAKKQSSGVERTVLPLGGKTVPRKCRETQSEVADYGRRSCDTDPRFSIDIGRLSIDGPRPSFEPPRASWDGHMMRRSNYSNHRVSVADTTPGDSAQTHQYYLDTSSRRRKSFERSGSKNSSLVIGGNEVDDNSVSGSKNAKVTPETFDFHQRKSNSNSLLDECSEVFELGIRDSNSVIENIEEKGSKKTGKWSKKWKFWGRSKNDEDDRYSRRDSVDRSSSVRGINGNMYRRASSVSLANGIGKKEKDELVLDRNRSVDNGLLKFYLTSPRNNNNNNNNNSNNNGRIAGLKKSSKTDNSRSNPRGVFRY